MIIFGGYEKWFKTYEVTKQGRYVIFTSSRTLDFNSLEVIEDEFDITFVSCVGNYIIFSINYDE